jgi:hypothetical protein
MGHAELPEQVLHVCVDGPHADSKLGSNLAVRSALPNQLEGLISGAREWLEDAQRELLSCGLKS